MDKTNGKHVCMLLKEQKCLDLPPTTGFFRHQMCKFRGLMLPCRWHQGTALFIRSRKSLKLEQDRQMYCGNWFVWHPYSPIKFYWDCFYIFVTFAAYFYMPLQVFYNCPNPYDPFILFTDVIAFINLITCFFTGYVGEDNKMIILKANRIAKHYLRTTFIFDLIGALPLQLIEPFTNCRYPSHTAMFIFKPLRLITFRHQWKNLLEQLELTYIKKVALTVTVRVIIFFHWMTYVNYQVPALCVHLYRWDRRLLVWLKRINVVNIQENSIFQKYTTNLFLVGGLCIGAGYYSPVDEHLIPQMLLTTTMSIIGLIFLTYPFTTLLRLVIYRQFETYLFNGRCRELEEYMIFKRIPKFVQRKIQLFINYKFNGHYFNEEAIQNTINEQIKQDINMHCCKMLVMNVPLFEDLPVALVNCIIFSMKQILYMPGELSVTFLVLYNFYCMLYLITRFFSFVPADI